MGWWIGLDKTIIIWCIYGVYTVIFAGISFNKYSHIRKYTMFRGYDLIMMLNSDGALIWQHLASVSATSASFLNACGSLQTSSNCTSTFLQNNHTDKLYPITHHSTNSTIRSGCARIWNKRSVICDLRNYAFVYIWNTNPEALAPFSNNTTLPTDSQT